MGGALLGETVLYTLSERDVERIAQVTVLPRPSRRAGAIFPMLVVELEEPQISGGAPTVGGVVFVGGVDVLWVERVKLGFGQGEFRVRPTLSPFDLIGPRV